MENLNQSTQHTNKEAQHDVHVGSHEDCETLQGATLEILNASKNLKHVFETSATRLKELLEKNTELPETWAHANAVLIRATSREQTKLLNELIESLEKCNNKADEGHKGLLQLHSSAELINPKMIDLLMIGSAGNGKSATGNSILGTVAFQATAGMSATRTSPIKATAKFEDLTVTVVDTPGVDTNGKSKLEVLEMSLNSIRASLELCNYSFTALLIVIKFGARFTQHESDTIKIIRGVLGNDVIQKYGVCVVTHGDNFEFEIEEEKVNGTAMTFEEWCREQVGEIGDIFKECNFRCVLFNNRTKDETKLKSQVENLISFLKRDQKYSEIDFVMAEEGLSKLTQDLFLPEVLLQANEFVNKIRSELVKHSNSKDQTQKLEQILGELLERKHLMKSGNWETSAQDLFFKVIEPLEMELKSKLKLLCLTPEKKCFNGSTVNVETKEPTAAPNFKSDSLGIQNKPTIEKTVFDGKPILASREPNCTTELAKIRKEVEKIKQKREDPATLEKLKSQISSLKERHKHFLQSDSGKESKMEIYRIQTEIADYQTTFIQNTKKSRFTKAVSWLGTFIR
ncbi:unnamed protein product, partial [Lymnaea stagnalis]